ncbi:MAG: adenylate/guanylate cyclase domain-containing protein [Desulfobacterales bacterium]|nr:MAG: adenylate/guanylate cyclase domain-containing protein [Desulfobacterales bacterium]
MPEKRARRRLCGILSADAVGYSRLMEKDEKSAIRTLEDSKRLMSELIEQFKGRVVDAPGDNLLAEFVSVVDAAECAVRIQEALNKRNAELPEDKRMEFRIGINLGDVIEEGGTIYGDGVIIAARLEKLAKAGGICISGTVHEQVKNKLSLRYEYLGEKSLKHISEPIRAYHVLMEPSVSASEKNGFLKLPDKPSIAVLPFVNMSGDSEQEYFSDGITEEIITGLSKIHEMFVIARNSSFTYKGKPVKVQQVSRDLGVQYVLECSVRKAGNRVRIAAQLVDALTGNHLWAERYDRDLIDIFALQDDITMKILTALQVELTMGEQARVFAKGTTNFEAYIKFLQASKYFSRGNFVLARQNAYEAIELDQNFPAPYVLVAWTHWFDARFETTESPVDSFKQAYSTSQKALALDDSIPDVHALVGGIHLYQRQHAKAIAAGERAVFLGPNHAEAHAIMAHILRFAGRFEEAISMIKKAVRLQPSYHYWYLMELSMCCYWTGRYEEAISVAKKFRQLAESAGHAEAIWGYHLMLTLNYMKLGLDQEARDAATELLRLFPAFTLEWDRRYSCYKNPEYLESQHKDLRKAGLK